MAIKLMVMFLMRLIRALMYSGRIQTPLLRGFFIHIDKQCILFVES